jgi:regulator of cell morphogenesis and NO signaling
MKMSPSVLIDENACAADIVRMHYRTAGVFRRYGIEYCCGVRWPLKMVVEEKKLDGPTLLRELEEACRVLITPAGLPYQTWSVDFLIDYIINIHHEYLRRSLNPMLEQVSRFVEEHRKKYPELEELSQHLQFLGKTMIPHLMQEENVIFPYIRQISHAYESQEAYATLLVRTLRKPVEALMHEEHEAIGKLLTRLRELTRYYTAPENACTSHRLAFSLLKELDQDLVQHIFLENEVLFPKAIAMEKELLARP